VVSDIWEQFLHIVSQEMGSRVVETWLKAISFTHWDAQLQTIYLKAPNSFVKDWVCKHYIPLIQTHIGRLLHVKDLKVLFVTSTSTKENHSTSAALQIISPLATPSVDRAIEPSSSTALSTAIAKKKAATINSSYTFDSFVVGPNNSLAYAAAQAITQKPGLLYNPLFIYGGSGLGKTHLLHAIGNEMKNNKKLTILYQTADRFVNEFINAIRFDKIIKFQEKYQSVDVLLIDDIQFISNKEQTQEAFFYIFNILYESHKQIVFSSDTVPQNIMGIAERLRSRLAWGLVTDVHAPSLEAKIAILKKKSALYQEIIAEQVFDFIASCYTANVRELEGALVRVMAFASLTQQSVTLELAKKVLIRVPTTVTRVMESDKIIAAIKKRFFYSLADLQSKSRNKNLSLVRQIAMFLMKKLTEKSLRDIGSYLGGRDHSTVMHGLLRIEELLAKDSNLANTVHEIERELIN
jgi:chromosomal replication initiator protein